MLIRYHLYKFKDESIGEKIGTITYFSTIILGLFAFFLISTDFYKNELSEGWKDTFAVLAWVCFAGPLAVTIAFTLLGILPINRRDYIHFCNISNSRQKLAIYGVYQLLVTVLILKGEVVPHPMLLYVDFIPTSLLILNFYFSKKRLSAYNFKKLEQKIDDLTEQLKNKN